MVAFSKPQLAAMIAIPIAVIGLGYYFSKMSHNSESDSSDDEDVKTSKLAVPTEAGAPTSPSGGKKKKKKKAKAKSSGTADGGSEYTALEKAQALKNEGNRLFNAKQYAGAIEKYNAAISMNAASGSELAKFYGNRAACYAKLEKHQEVVRDCTLSLKQDNDYVKARQRRGHAYEVAGDYEKALEDYAVAGMKSPTADIQESVERILKVIGLQKAKEQIKAKVGRFPPSNIVKTYIETFEKNKEEFSASANQKVNARLDQEISENPTDASLYYQRGMNYLHRHDYDFALDDFIKCSEIDPTHVEALVQQGTLLHLSGRLDEALSSLDRALILEPNHVYARVKKANVYLFKQMIEEANMLMLEACGLAPEDPVPMLHLGQVYAQMGKIEDAVDSFYKVVKIDPKNYDAFNQLGLVLTSLGEHRQKEAFQAFEKAVTCKDNPADAYNNYGLVLQACGKTDECLDKFDKAIKQDPNCAIAYCNKGFILLNKDGNVEEATKLYEKAIEIDPNCIEPYCNLAMVNLQTGDFQKAIECYDKAIELSFMEPDLTTIYGFREAAVLRQKLADIQ
eukprot:Nk52_evm1s962 gene=Nk52_evmTU1s962